MGLFAAALAGARQSLGTGRGELGSQFEADPVGTHRGRIQEAQQELAGRMAGLVAGPASGAAGPTDCGAQRTVLWKARRGPAREDSRAVGCLWLRPRDAAKGNVAPPARQPADPDARPQWPDTACRGRCGTVGAVCQGGFLTRRRFFQIQRKHHPVRLCGGGRSAQQQQCRTKGQAQANLAGL